MVKRFYAIFLIIVLLFTLVLSVRLVMANSIRPSGAPVFRQAVYRRPVADGSFIQWWLVKDWDDKRWLEEYKVLKEAGMHYLILTPAAFHETDAKTGKEKIKTIYPTKLKGFESVFKGKDADYRDVVDACLRTAQQIGFKVFLGLNFSEEWWSKRRDAEWIYARMREGNSVADELWSRYYEKYPDAFYGWYWCWEVDNGYFKRLDFFNSMEVLTNALKIQTEHLEKTNKRLPLMIAPYMNWMLGTPSGYAKMWEYVFANSGMKEGDVFCPQDSIGAGGLRIDNAGKWFAELRKAVDTVPGLKFWADTETFDSKDWTGATMDKFIKQMEILQPYVDNYVTFSYSHYFSPNIVNQGFHETYSEYVRTGTLETVPPTVPNGFKAKLGKGGKVSMTWDASEDNTGVCGYYIYRNGRRIGNMQVPRGSSDKEREALITGMTDVVPDTANTYIYEVKAYDFAGNVSSSSKPVAIAVK